MLGGLSFVTCCFPVGLVSAGFGLSGVLSLFAFAAVFISYRRDLAASEA